jgi:alpha-tubulin suppressor-like RCC1 family protein
MGDKLPTVDLGKGRRAVSLSLGGFHSCAVLDDGSAKCWGMNDVGQLGQGDSQNRGNAAGQMGDALRPIDVGPGRTVKRIATQYDHVCALLDDGGLRCWGWNNGGQLGLGDTNDRGSQRNQLGNGLPKVALGVTSPIALVGVGFDHSCVLFDNDRFKCWGINGGGQLGVGNRSRYGDRAGTMGATLPFVQF